jgi:hypothetical protein
VEDPSSVSTRTPMVAGDVVAAGFEKKPLRLRSKIAATAVVVAAAAGLVWLAARAPGDDDGRAVVTVGVADAAGVQVAPPVPSLTTDAAVVVAADAMVVAIADAAPAAVVPDAAVAERPGRGGHRSKREREKEAAAKSTGARSLNGPPGSASTTTPTPAPAPAPTPAAGLPASSCARDRFAQVYQAAAPSHAQVMDALRLLKACYEARYIGAEDYGRIQAALIGKM